MAKQEVTRSTTHAGDPFAELTDRQRDVLRAAYFGGYYDRPRDVEGSEIAARLDISTATFSEHRRAAERKLLAAVFDDSGADQNP